MSPSCGWVKADQHTKGFNLSNGQWVRNAAPREGGRFLWRQIYNARKCGARSMYGAMWDEYDEGTQFMPAITKTADLPQDESGKFTLIACDVDGYDIPADWYMRIAGYGSSLVKSERHNEDRFPEKELREWEPKFEVRSTLQSMLASGSGVGRGSGGGSGSSGTSARAQPHRNVARRAPPDREQEDPPPPPYSRDVDAGAGVSPVVSRGPDLPRRDSRPPPPIPPRPDLQVGLSPTSPHSPGPPPISHASRPTGTPPHSPASPKRGPSPAHQAKSSTSPYHLPASQSAPMESYSHHMPMPQVPMRYQPEDSGPSSFAPTAAPFTMPQPGGPWYPPQNTQPAWPTQSWNNPNLMAPPGQPPGPYGYQSGYNNDFSEAMRANYGYSVPQAAPLLEPQQYNPGPPPPIPPARESLLRRFASGRLLCNYTLNDRLGP